MKKRESQHIVVWEFRARAGYEVAFESAYAPNGLWGQLFEKGAGYHGTELLRDPSTPGRYLTIDRWSDLTEFSQFRDAHSAEYATLDAVCEAWTESEQELGAWEPVVGSVAVQLSAEDRARLLRDIQTRGGDIHAKQEAQWIREAHRLTRKLASEGEATSSETRTAFWIRLSGLLSEVRDHLAGQQRRFLALTETDLELRGRIDAIYLAPPRRVLEAIEAVKGVLTDEDLLYLAYRRDVECHPWQDSYRLRLVGGRLKDRRTVFGRTWKIEDLDLTLEKLLREHGVNEAAIAIEFARRLVEPMDAVEVAAKAWFPTT